MKEVKGNSALCSNALEHLVALVLVVIFIAIGYYKHKKKRIPADKLKPLAIFRISTFILVLAKLPWKVWFNLY
ncbi:hypothetical protein CW732_01650 [Olleya sp. Bg11-27]|nr:hypothetical protein CW732_01650 [Olleya sp. Bg11-27]